MTISMVADRFGLTLRTLRFYEEKGLLFPAREGNERLYTTRDVLKIRIILTGKRLGFSIEEIRRLLDNRSRQSEPSGLIEDLGLSKLEIEQRIDELTTKVTSIERAISELRSTLVTSTR